MHSAIIFPTPNDTKILLFHKRSWQTQRATPIFRISPQRRRHPNVQPRKRIQHRSARMRTAYTRKRLEAGAARRNNLRSHRPQLHKRTHRLVASSIGVAIPRAKTNTVTSQNTTLTGKQTSQQATTQRI